MGDGVGLLPILAGLLAGSEAQKGPWDTSCVQGAFLESALRLPLIRSTDVGAEYDVA